MSQRRGSVDLEFEDRVYWYYRDLKDEKIRVRAKKGLFHCPYCDNKKEYNYNEIRDHASRVGSDSKHARSEDRAKHRGLLRYLDKKFDSKSSSSLSRSKRDNYDGTKRNASRSPIRVSTKKIKINEKRETDVEDADKATANYRRDRIAAKSQQCTSKELNPYQPNDREELFVWPWMAIVANIPVEYKDGKTVGESGSKLKEEWTAKGFKPVRVTPLWTFRGHSGFAVVQFEKHWDGFTNAMMFEKAFEVKNHGYRDWKLGKRGDGLYGWIARSEDYNRGGVIGEHLRKIGDLKSVSQIEREEKGKNERLVSSLESTLERKENMCNEIIRKISKTEKRIGKVMTQKEEMTQSYNNELEKLKQRESKMLEKIVSDHERSKAHLEARRKQLQEREAHNENELEKLKYEREMNEIAILEQKKADESMLNLADDHKREKEKLRTKILELEKKLDAKQALELEIERLRGAISIREHMNEEGDSEQKKKLESIQQELKEKEEELEDIEDLNQALVVKERKTNDELQDARKELINGLMDSRANIRVKRMGELDEKPFIEAVRRKYEGAKDMNEKAEQLISLWEDNLMDPNWYPIKVITVGERHQEVIDDEDEKLQSLKNEFGDEPYDAVITAFKELNEYNPSGRYPLPELWNSKEGKKAALKDGVSLLLGQWKVLRGKKKRT